MGRKVFAGEGGTMKQPNVQLALTCPCNGMRGDLLGEEGVCISDAPLRWIGGCAQQRKGAASRRSVAAAPSDKERGVGCVAAPRTKQGKEGATPRRSGVALEVLH